MGDKFMELRVKLPLINPDASIVGDNRKTFPSSQWESSAKSDYRVFFTPGPPAKFPDVSIRDKERKNNPHAQRIYKEVDKDGNKWSAKNAIYGEDKYATPVTDYVDTFTRKNPSKQAKRSSWITRQALPAGSIVPGYDYSEAVNDRVLPVCPRDMSITLTTTPFLRYTGKKKPITAPFHGFDGGAPADEGSRLCGGGVRTGYTLAYSTMHRPE